MASTKGSSAVTDPHAFYRCYKALHIVSCAALPCIDDCLCTWHANKRQSIPPCSTNQCPSGKKPKLPSSCQSCVDWSREIEAVYYQQAFQPVGAAQQSPQKQIPWANVNSALLGTSHIEVAKAFVLRLQKVQYVTISDVDSASVLMIMTRFSEFHKGDQTFYPLIEKVSTETS